MGGYGLGKILLTQLTTNNLTTNNVPSAVRRWRKLYFLLVGELALLVLLFYALTRWAS